MDLILAVYSSPPCVTVCTLSRPYSDSFSCFSFFNRPALISSPSIVALPALEIGIHSLSPSDSSRPFLLHSTLSFFFSFALSLFPAASPPLLALPSHSSTATPVPRLVRLQPHPFSTLREFSHPHANSLRSSRCCRCCQSTPAVHNPPPPTPTLPTRERGASSCRFESHSNSPHLIICLIHLILRRLPRLRLPHIPSVGILLLRLAGTIRARVLFLWV